MIATGMRAVVLPKGAGLLGHLEVISAHFLADLRGKPFAFQDDQPHQVADEGVRRPDVLVEALLPPLRTELRRQLLPELGMELRRRDAVEKRIILAGLRHVRLSAVVAEPFAVEGPFANELPDPFGLRQQLVPPIQFRRLRQDLRIRHVRRIINPLVHELRLVRMAPLDEHPRRKVLQEPVLVEILCIEPEEPFHARLQELNRLPVSRPLEVVRDFQDEPHRPVGNVVLVDVVARIAHRHHPLRQMRELLGEREIAEERPLDLVLAREEVLGRTGEVAVAKPARTLAARTVREHVDRILHERLARRLEDLAVRRIRERARPRRVWILVGAHLQSLDRRLALQHDHLGILEGVGLERLKLILARFPDIPGDDVVAPKSIYEIQLAVDQGLVKPD